MTKEEISNWFRSIQLSICNDLEAIDGQAQFVETKWDRPEGGGGLTRLLADGQIFEKAGVNYSAVHGPIPGFLNMEIKGEASEFYATGTSIVIHPKSPLVPIIHFNTRYFEMNNGTKWFGGGIDLTPIYVVNKDIIKFHDRVKQICDAHHPSFYTKYKPWADSYFYIKHRKETRGIGGIFFDHIVPGQDIDFEAIWGLVKALGAAFASTYIDIIKPYLDLPYTKTQKEFQLFRRGRYAEFNLVYDRGTKFGLETGGRTESILMSLPPESAWPAYENFKPGSEEEATIAYLRNNYIPT